MKEFTGTVISTKTFKTAVVSVRRLKIHPLYKKRISIIRKFHVHDLIGVKEGDQVKFVQVRPISKTKKWKITEVIKG